jgi:hypothetical protein
MKTRMEYAAFALASVALAILVMVPLGWAWN